MAHRSQTVRFNDPIVPRNCLESRLRVHDYVKVRLRSNIRDTDLRIFRKGLVYPSSLLVVFLAFFVLLSWTYPTGQQEYAGCIWTRLSLRRSLRWRRRFMPGGSLSVR